MRVNASNAPQLTYDPIHGCVPADILKSALVHILTGTWKCLLPAHCNRLRLLRLLRLVLLLLVQILSLRCVFSGLHKLHARLQAALADLS